MPRILGIWLFTLKYLSWLSITLRNPTTVTTYSELQYILISDLLRLLIDVPRPKLTKLGLYYSKFEVSSEEEEIAISPLLHEFIQTNLNLTNLTIYVRAGIQELKDDLEKLDQSLKSINWDLTTRFEIVIPRTSAKKYY